MLRLGGGPVAAFVAGLTSISRRIYRECCGVAGPGEGWVWGMPIAIVLGFATDRQKPFQR
jgi:hypothetical protein